MVSSFVVLYILFVKPFLKKLGENRLVVENERISLINYITYGIREIYCYAVEGNFMKRYEHYSFKSSVIGNTQQVLKSSQKFWIETLGIVAIFFLIVYNSQMGFDELILLGLYAYKIIPSINRMTGYLSSINYYSSSIDKVNNYD